MRSATSDFLALGHVHHIDERTLVRGRSREVGGDLEQNPEGRAVFALELAIPVLERWVQMFVMRFANHGGGDGVRWRWRGIGIQVAAFLKRKGGSEELWGQTWSSRRNK